MSRKGPTKIRSITADPLFQNQLISKLTNYIMKDGKRSVAQSQVYHTLKLLATEDKTDALALLESAVEQIKPKIEVRPRRIGGAVYQVPTPIRVHRQVSLALRWLIVAARKRPNKDYHTFSAKLAAELKDAAGGQGAAITKRLEVEKMAEANKAFAHLRW